MKQCPFCNHENPEHAHFCAGCGAELERQCSACGKVVPADARFCPQCGAVIVTRPPTPWIERRFAPEVRTAIHTLLRSLSATMLVLGILLVLLTPPPRVIDEGILLFGAAVLYVISEVFKGRKQKPPDDDDGQRVDPEPPPTDGLKLDVPDYLIDKGGDDTDQQPNPQPLGGMEGPFLN